MILYVSSTKGSLPLPMVSWSEAVHVCCMHEQWVGTRVCSDRRNHGRHTNNLTHLYYSIVWASTDRVVSAIARWPGVWLPAISRKGTAKLVDGGCALVELCYILRGVKKPHIYEVILGIQVSRLKG